MTLCGSCNKALSFGNGYSRYTELREQTIHSGCRSFLAAVKEGCYICQGLFSQLPEEWKRELHRRGDICEPPAPAAEPQADRWREKGENPGGLTWYSRKNAYTRDGTVQLDVQMGVPNTEASSQNMEIPRTPCLYLSAIEPSSASLTWSLSSSSTNSEETFSKIKAWLERCENTHTKCRSHRDEARDKGNTTWHPTRLVEVMSKPQSGDEVEGLGCRIVELKPDNIPQDLEYITLSHRWPQIQQGFPKLTVDKLLHWKTSLPVEELSHTFRDALLVAKRVGIPYIWIDSLCIIQEGDELADWKKEAPMMDKVYSQAEFNICVSTTVQNENDGGLFSQREPSEIGSLQIEVVEDTPEIVKIKGSIETHGSVQGDGSVRGERSNENDGDDFDRRHRIVLSGHLLIAKRLPLNVWDEGMDSSPLISRGWIFQEQLLSRANLHFTNHEVFFECLEMRASESLGSDSDYCDVWDRWKVFFKESLQDPYSVEERHWGLAKNSDEDTLYESWHKLLSQYTTRQLTQFDDRLVALSGVAQYFKKVLPESGFYIAGLWQTRLVTELLWQMTQYGPRETFDVQKRRRHQFTFSWLSVEGEVTNDADPHDSEMVTPLADIKVIRYRTSLEKVDPTIGEEQPLMEEIFSLPSAPAIEIKLTGFLRPVMLDRVGFTAANKIRQSLDFGSDTHRDWDLLLCLGGHSGIVYGNVDARGVTVLDFEISSADLHDLNRSGRLFAMPLARTYRSNNLMFILLELVEAKNGISMGRFRRIGVYHEDRKNEVLSEEEEGLSEEEQGLSEEEGGPPEEEEGLPEEEDGLSEEENGLSEEEDGLSEEEGGLPEVDEWLFSEGALMGREAIEASYASSLGIYEGVSGLPGWRHDRLPTQDTIFIV